MGKRSLLLVATEANEIVWPATLWPLSEITFFFFFFQNLVVTEYERVRS